MTYLFNSKDVLITQLGEEGVAFNSETNEYFSLNETAFKVLQGVQDGLPVAAICETLQIEYSIAAPDCEKEVNDILQTFLSKKLIMEP